MPLIAWKQEFVLGVEEIDEQHKRILSTINKMYSLFDSKRHEQKREIDQIIKELNDYAIYHFETEEKYFKLFGYEQAEEHVGVHNQYRQKIEEWTKRYNENEDKKIFFEMSNFLESWWTWHINHTDRAYIPFMKANGVK